MSTSPTPRNEDEARRIKREKREALRTWEGDAAERARTLAFDHLLEYVRNCREHGWPPASLIPRIAWRLEAAVSHADAYEELTHTEQPRE